MRVRRLHSILFIGVAVLVAPSIAAAQCSQADGTGDGIPDVCPAGSNYIQGTAAGERIRGTNGADCIFGLGGDDDIRARNGDDYICAGDGSDQAGGGPGNDLIFGGDGDDDLRGAAGDDSLNGGAGDDDILGGAGADALSGEDGDDDLNGGGGNDSLSGGNGTDTLDGGGGTNTCVEEVPGTSERLSNCNTVTYAAVSSLAAFWVAGNVGVTWETTTEVGAVAFRLWRRERNGRLVLVGEVGASLEGSPHGARYFLRDDGAPVDGPLEYIVEERTVSGGRVEHGPFTRVPDVPSPRDALFATGTSPRRVEHPVTLQRRSLTRTAISSAPVRLKDAATPIAAVVTVDAAGVIDVDASVLATALETGSEVVTSAIQSGDVELRLLGESVAWHAVDAGSALRFIAPEVDSPFSPHHRYLLSLAPGVTMVDRSFVEGSAAEPHSYVDTLRLEENVFPGPSGGPDPRRDLFFWHAMGRDDEALIPVPLPALNEDTARELRVYVHAATEHPEQPHRVELVWGVESLGVFDLFGRQRHTITVPMAGIPADLENELTVRHLVAGEAPPSLYVDAVEIDYQRTAEADASMFRFGAAEDGEHSVGGLTSPTVHLYDVTDRAAPKRYGEVPVDESGRLRFTDAGPGTRFIAVAPERISAPIEVTPRFESDLRDTQHSAGYVVIAATHLVEAARVLVEHREADGYRVLLVDIEDVYWEFSDGEADPLAIRRFLSFARTQWEVGPRFAALVGKANLDYRDLRGLGGNWLPAALASTDGGLFPSDSMLGDVVGFDGVPEIAVGRLPVSTPEELAHIVDAISSFEINHESFDALFAADDSSRGEFAAASRHLAEWSAPQRTQMVDLNTESLEDARERLLSKWSEQLAWLSYVGHGGVDRIATEGLLTLDDVPGLAQTAKSAPVVLGWSCNLTRFDLPGYASLGEELVNAGTSAGVFSATGWSNHFDTDLLRSAFTEAAFASDAETIGDAMLRAHEAARGAPVALHRVYALLGDPALRLREAKAVTIPAPEPEVPGAPTDGARSADDLPPSSSGCEIAPSGAGQGPFGLGILIVGAAWAIRRRRP